MVDPRNPLGTKRFGKMWFRKASPRLRRGHFLSFIQRVCSSKSSFSLPNSKQHWRSHGVFNHLFCHPTYWTWNQFFFFPTKSLHENAQARHDVRHQLLLAFMNLPSPSLPFADLPSSGRAHISPKACGCLVRLIPFTLGSTASLSTWRINGYKCCLLAVALAFLYSLCHSASFRNLWENLIEIDFCLLSVFAGGTPLGFVLWRCGN